MIAYKNDDDGLTQESDAGTISLAMLPYDIADIIFAGLDLEDVLSMASVSPMHDFSLWDGLWTIPT